MANKHTIANLPSPKHYKDAISQDYADKTYFSKTGGVISGEVDMSDQKIIKLGYGTVDTDAASIAYVKQHITGVDPFFEKRGNNGWGQWVGTLT